MVDTHSHIYLSDYDVDRDLVVERALNSGVNKILLPNIDISTVAPMLDCVERYPDVCYPMIGLHPTSVNESFNDDVDKILSLFYVYDKYIAIGEIGIDLYWDKSFMEEQMRVFDRQLSFAVSQELPVVIHCRDAFPQMFEVLSGYKGDVRFRGVVHSFSGTESDIDEILSYMNLYIGINGTVTFKKSKIPDLLSNVPIDRILPETDSPYLTPVPYRGKRNESSYVSFVVKKLSEISKITEENMGDILNSNALSLFKIQ